MFRRSIVRMLAVAACVFAAGCGNGGEKCINCPCIDCPTGDKYKMEAKLNGSDWRSSVPASVPGADTLHAIAAYGLSQMLIVRGQRLAESANPDDFSSMGFTAITPLEAGTIQLRDIDPANPNRSGHGWFTRGTGIWETDVDHRGTVTITRVDRDRRVIEGVFEFTAIRADDGSTVDVKSGVFRCKLDVIVEAADLTLAPQLR